MTVMFTDDATTGAAVVKMSGGKVDPYLSLRFVRVAVKEGFVISNGSSLAVTAKGDAALANALYEWGNAVKAGSPHMRGAAYDG